MFPYYNSKPNTPPPSRNTLGSYPEPEFYTNEPFIPDYLKRYEKQKAISDHMMEDVFIRDGIDIYIEDPTKVTQMEYSWVSHPIPPEPKSIWRSLAFFFKKLLIMPLS